MKARGRATGVASGARTGDPHGNHLHLKWSSVPPDHLGYGGGGLINGTLKKIFTDNCHFSSTSRGILFSPVVVAQISKYKIGSCTILRRWAEENKPPVGGMVIVARRL